MKRLLFLFGIFICTFAFAQIETTKWYIDGVLYDTTTCESGGDINIPTLPERFGYDFQGWEPAIYDMSTLDTTINPSGFSAGKNYSSGSSSWYIDFNYGVIYGVSFCSTTQTNPRINDVFDTSSGGRYCFCRVERFVPNTDDSIKIYEPSVSLWTYSGWAGNNNTHCTTNCAYFCLSICMNSAGCRANLYRLN